MDIVFVTLFHIAVGTAIAWCSGRCAMPDGHCLNILLFWRWSTAALVFRVDACFTLLSPFSHSSLSLIGLVTSVDIKQQSLSLKKVQKNAFNYAMDTQYAIYFLKSPLSSHKTTLKQQING